MKEKIYNKCGWRDLRFWGNEIKNNIDECKNIISGEINV